MYCCVAVNVNVNKLNCGGGDLSDCVVISVGVVVDMSRR